MSKLLCIGHITLDTFLFVEDVEIHCDLDDKECVVSFPYGAKIPVSHVHYGIGGGAANVVIGTKLLGIDSGIFAVIGDDRQGKEITELFESHGVSNDLIKKDRNLTDQSSILSYGNERTIFSYNADRDFNLSEVDLDKYDHLFVSSIGKNVDLVYDQLVEIKRRRPEILLYYNPGSKELKLAHHSIQKLLPVVDYLIANVEEGCTLLNPGLKREAIEMEDLVSMLQQKGIKNVVLTDAERGVYFNDGYSVEHSEARLVKPVEKTGAGDAFASGFISATIYGKSMKDAVLWGILNSSSVVLKPGAQNGLMNLAEIQVAAKS